MYEYTVMCFAHNYCYSVIYSQNYNNDGSGFSEVVGMY